MKFSTILHFAVSLCFSGAIQQAATAQVPSPSRSPTLCAANFSKDDFMKETAVTSLSPISEGARMSRDGQRLSHFWVQNLPDGSPRPANEKFAVDYVNLATGTFLSGYANEIKNPKIVKAVCYNQCDSPEAWSHVLYGAKMANMLISLYMHAIIQEIAPYNPQSDNTEYFRLEMLLKNLLKDSEKKLANISPITISAMNLDHGTPSASASISTYQGCKGLTTISAVDYSNWRNLTLTLPEKTISYTEANAPYRKGTLHYSQSIERNEYLALQLEMATILDKIRAFNASNPEGTVYKNIVMIINAFKSGTIERPGK